MIVLPMLSNWLSRFLIPALTNFQPRKPSPWSPPPFHFFTKLDFDVAIRESFSICAVVDSNHEGSILLANSLIGPPCEPDIEEATAAFLAVQNAKELKLDKIILEGDSLAVTLTSYWKISSLYAQLLQ
jgi:hypothetical protein